MQVNSLIEFTGRANDYKNYRPSYPQELFTMLQNTISFSKDWVVADIGSGTGIMTELLLQHSNNVYSIEPNEDMRNIAEEQFYSFTNFHSFSGSAESTQLPNNSIDLIVCAQAFHYFKKQIARTEFKRILKDSGYVFLIWNIFDDEQDFYFDYISVLERHAANNENLKKPNFVVAQKLNDFFHPFSFSENTFNHQKPYSLEQFLGQIFSYSYVPPRHDPKSIPMEKDLTDFFLKYCKDDYLTIKYQAKTFLGKL